MTLMWTKPYGMKEGFLIGGGLILIGLMLELSVGPVDWDAFRWPVNGIVLAGFLVLIAIIFLLNKKVYGLQFIGTYKAAIPTLVYAVVLTIIMGLTRQENPAQFSPLIGGVREGPGLGGLNHMLSFWPFVLIYVYMAVILGLVVLRQLRMWAVANFSLLHSFTPTLLHSFTPSLLHSNTPTLLHSFTSFPSGIISGDDHCHIGQCRRTVAEDDHGEGRTRMACADLTASDCGVAFLHRAERVYHGNLR